MKIALTTNSKSYKDCEIRDNKSFHGLGTVQLQLLMMANSFLSIIIKCCSQEHHIDIYEAQYSQLQSHKNEAPCEYQTHYTAVMV